MSLKTKFLCGTILGLSWFSAQKAHASVGTDIKKDTLEISTDTLKHNQSQQKNNTISLADAISSDSLIMAKKEANFANAEKLMFYLIANFEGFRSHPYKLRGENFLTYNWGNTITAEGEAVKSTDRITNFEESYECYDAFMKTPTKNNPIPLKDAMLLSLPIDKMEDFEIAVMVEIGYNYGPGLFINKMTKQPTKFANLAATYFNNRTPENLKAFGKSFLAHCTAKHRVHPVLKDRRQIAFNILKGNIIIYIDENAISHLPPEKQKLAVNLKTNILGVLNGTHGNTETIQKRLESGIYTCESGDSIQHAIEKDLNKGNRKVNRKPQNLTLAQIKAAKRKLAQR